MVYGAAAKRAPVEGSSRMMSTFTVSGEEGVGEGMAVSITRRRQVKMWRLGSSVQVAATWPRAVVRGGME